AESQKGAANAWENGYFEKSLVPVKDINGITLLDRDEHMRPGSTVEALSTLNPAFAKLAAQAGFDEVALQKYHWIEAIDHVHTAANSSGIVDGELDRKSTRLNSSHVSISYAVFCLKKKKNDQDLFDN